MTLARLGFVALVMMAARPVEAQIAAPSVPSRARGKMGGQSAPVTGANGTLAAPVKRRKPLFLKAERGALFLGELRYRNVGANLPDLFTRFLKGDDAGAVRLLTSAQAAGVRFVRCAGTATNPADFALWERDPNAWLAAFDQMLAAADRIGLTLVPSLLYDRQTLPAYVGRGGTPETPTAYLTTNSASNALAVRYVTGIVTHFRNDPRVLFWEIGDAYNRDADGGDAANGQVTSAQVRAFLIEMATLIHRLDKRHLVATGNIDLPPDAWHRREAGRGLPTPKVVTGAGLPLDSYPQYAEMLDYLNPDPCDIASVQLSPPGARTPLWLTHDDSQALTFSWAQTALGERDPARSKPLFVSRFAEPIVRDGSEQPAMWTLDLLRRMQNEGAPLAAVAAWSDTNSGDAATFSPQSTPRLVFALNATNNALARAIVSETVVSNAPAIDTSERATQDDRLRGQIEQLRTRAIASLAQVRLTPGQTRSGQANDTGVVLHTPDPQTAAFVTRDAALMLGTDFLPAGEVEGWVRLLARTQATREISTSDGRIVPSGSIAEQIALDGTPAWFSAQARPPRSPADFGNNPIGELPPADNAFWFLHMVREHLRLTGKPELFRARIPMGSGDALLRDVCTRAFDSVAADTTTGLISCGEQGNRVDWGFASTVRKTGFALWPSLLRWQAARALSDLFQAVADPQSATRYDVEANKIKASLAKTFYLAGEKVDGKDTGLLLSATSGLGHRDDLWGAAFALWLGVLPDAQIEAVSRHLLTVYQAGGSIVEGQVRPIPASGTLGGGWEQSSDLPGTGQNGAFWAVPSGWYIAALRRVNPVAATQMMGELLASLQARNAPYQSLNPALKAFLRPGYVPSLTAPAIALRIALEGSLDTK